MRFSATALVFGLTTISAAAEPNRPATDRPNLVFIVADDLGWGDLGVYGSPICETPRIDELAGSGARFERLFVSAASAPTSAAILTGLHPLLAGVCSDTAGGQQLHHEQLTLAEKIGPLGYETGYFGIWRHDANRPRRPDDQGFETFAGICRDSWIEGEIEIGSERKIIETDAAQLLADEVRRFISENAEKPFLCIFNHPAPLWTSGCSAKLVQKYREAGCTPELAEIYAAVGSLDRDVGAILDTLAEHNIEENTVVIFLSDNGPRKVEGRFNASMYGAHGSLHEGAVRSPCFVRWSGSIEPGTTIDEICHVMDLHTTAVELAGGDLSQSLEPPRVRWLQGMSLTPLLVYGHVERWPNRNLNEVAVEGRDFNWDDLRSTVRVSRWRAIRDPAWRREEIGEAGEQWELYDIRADPAQAYDLAEFYPAVLGRLKSDFIQWYRRVTTHGFDPAPTEIGRDDWPEVRLHPAAASEIEAGRLLWPVAVKTAGERKVVAVCRPSEGKLEIEIVGAETLVKQLDSSDEWLEIRIGDLQFEQGESELTARFPPEMEIRELKIGD